MEIKLAKSNRDFRDTYKYLFEKYEVELQLFYVNVNNDNIILDSQHTRGGVYDENGELALLFLDANPYKLLLFGVNNSLSANLCLVRYLNDKRINITGIMGSKDDTDLFKQAYDKELKLELEMDIMKLEKLNQLPVNGRLVEPKEADLDFIAKGIINFSQEALHDKMSYQDALEQARHFIHNDYFYIFENEEGIKTSFLRLRSRGKNGLTISAVYTYDEYRGRGYAKSMINLACELALQKVSYVTLFVDKNNPISNKVYIDNGFTGVRDIISYKTLE